MDLGQVIRPAICTTGYKECAAAFFGSGILVRSKTEFYFVTARHVLTNHNKALSDLRIPSELGSHEMIPQLFGFYANYGNENHFEDLLIVHLDAEYVKHNKLQDQFWPLQNPQDCILEGQAVIALGFPEEEQEVDVDNNKGYYKPFFIKGSVSEVDQTERMLVISTPPKVSLKTFNQMSGGAVFTYDAKLPQDATLVGVILQGGRTANIIRALAALCVFNLINHFEATDLKQKSTISSSIPEG